MKLPSFLQRKSSPEQFWQWFAANANTLRSGDMNANVTKIAEQLARIHPDLCPGISMQTDTYQLEISPGGLQGVAPIAVQVARAAPQIRGWNVVAFRQRTEPPVIQMAGQELDLNLTKFISARNSENYLDVTLYLPLPVQVDEQVLGQLGFLTLDHLLGEEVVMTRLGELAFENMVSAPRHARPLPELLTEMGLQ
ncbi:MAG: hypothetical protein JNJ45_01900 [Chthonomonas sp.]|nr:hypothetical protein [Chthonomonas sp.]